MKKIYQVPATRQVSIKQCGIICASPGLRSSGYNSASESLSRHNDKFWDDEEDY